MKDAARAAAMSDPALNRWFQRRWVEPPADVAPHLAAGKPTNDDELAITGLALLHEWQRLGSAASGPR